LHRIDVTSAVRPKKCRDLLGTSGTPFDDPREQRYARRSNEARTGMRWSVVYES
jgi:hypothetical protein